MLVVEEINVNVEFKISAQLLTCARSLKVWRVIRDAHWTIKTEVNASATSVTSWALTIRHVLVCLPSHKQSFNSLPFPPNLRQEFILLKVSNTCYHTDRKCVTCTCPHSLHNNRNYCDIFKLWMTGNSLHTVMSSNN